MPTMQIAGPICGSVLAMMAQPEVRPMVELIILPSDGLERARPRINLSNFVANPGPRLESLMRSTAFRATQHKYDL